MHVFSVCFCFFFSPHSFSFFDRIFYCCWILFNIFSDIFCCPPPSFYDSFITYSDIHKVCTHSHFCQGKLQSGRDRKERKIEIYVEKRDTWSRWRRRILNFHFVPKNPTSGESVFTPFKSHCMAFRLTFQRTFICIRIGTCKMKEKRECLFVYFFTFFVSTLLFLLCHRSFNILFSFVCT